MDVKDELGRVWILVAAELPKTALGVSLAVPVENGTEWLEIGTITAGYVQGDGSVSYGIRLADGVTVMGMRRNEQ